MSVKFFDLGRKPEKNNAPQTVGMSKETIYPSFYIRQKNSIPFLEEMEVGDDKYVVAIVHKRSHEDREEKREGQKPNEECNMEFEIREIGTVKAEDGSEKFLRQLGMKAKEE